MESLLQIENYSITFWQYDEDWNRRELKAVWDLNLTLSAGEVVAVVGASGSGKSLLAHGILGILPYNAAMTGRLIYGGEELTRERIEALRGREIVLIPQSASFLDPLMKVGKQIRKGRGGASPKKRMKRILEDYHLPPEVAEQYPFELSGGMTRRVLLTMAQMEQPRLVIADEPTPGLNKELADMAFRQLQELAAQGAGVLLITHDLEQALAVADRIVVFYQGRILAEGKALDFAREEALKHPYTKALWRAMPRHGLEKISEIPGTGLANQEAVLEARHVSFQYGKRKSKVLEGVNLTLGGGEIVGLMAPSGYGKTTLCKLLAGYEKPQEGEILLNQKPIWNQKGHCPVQMIWQQGIEAVNPRMRMKEILKEGGEVQDRVLEGLGIQESWLERFPVELSGGELQRFCIARALGKGTRFLLGDEMTAMLDLISQHQIWKFLIQEVRERGLGILAVSHHKELLEQICDRIEYLHREEGNASGK